MTPIAYTESCKSFDQLTVYELYEILKLRQEVFCVEQNCVYLDLDDLDQSAHHLMIRDDSGLLAAYARLLPIDIPYQGHISIGRVVSNPRVRKLKYGRLMMQRAIHIVKEIHGHHPIKIGAQQYLENFYRSLGFIPTGEKYIEDGIPHMIMVLGGD